MQLWPFWNRASIERDEPQSSLQLRILSFNIRYATSEPFPNEKPWPERLPRLVNQLRHETRFLASGLHDVSQSTTSSTVAASIICLQEVLHAQLIDILASLNCTNSGSSGNPTDGPYWAHVGVGRDDGHTKGEYSPILYPTIFRLLHSDVVWLSPTPDRPSKGWDAGSIRIVSIAVLECKATGQRVLASSTHLDNAGPESRKHSVRIILETLKRVEKEWTKDGDGGLPVFLAGDFNSFPDQEAYLLMKESGYVDDLREYVEPEQRYNDSNTFTGFEPEKDKDEQGRIDFIWLGPKDGVRTSKKKDELPDDLRDASWAVDGYAVLPNVFDDGLYLSDHRCVVGDVYLLHRRA